MSFNEQKINAVEAILGYTFRDRSLLWEALQAAGSGVTRAGRRTVSEGNYRLAVVGDSALDFVLAGQWFRTGGSRAEWSEARQTVLCNAKLADIGRKASLHHFYCLNPRNSTEPSTKQVATLVEAVIGAVCEDSDLSHVPAIMQTLGLNLPVREEPFDYLWHALLALAIIYVMICALILNKEYASIEKYAYQPRPAFNSTPNSTSIGPAAAI